MLNLWKKMMTYKTVSITDLELFVYMIGRGSQPHEALESMIKHNQELKHTRQYLIARLTILQKKVEQYRTMIDDIDKSEDK